MKPTYAKVLSIVICAVIALSATTFARTEIHGSHTDSTIYLYHNDRAWTRANHPAHVSEKGVYYAPLTFFIQLSDVNARINETLKTFVITRGDKYLSFDIASGYAANQDMIRIPLRTYEYQDEHYVPMDAVCFYLDLEFEVIVSKHGGDIALRITNGQQQNTFQALLRKRHPYFFDEADPSSGNQNTGTGNGKDTTAVGGTSDQDTTEAVRLTDRVIYLTFENTLGEYTGEILDMLKEYSCKATFFVDEDKLADNIPLLMRMVSEGHAIAIRVTGEGRESYASTSDIISDIEVANEMLSKILKYKSGVWLAPHGSSSTAALSESWRAELYGLGYTTWDNNIIAPTSSRQPQYAANSVITGIWNNTVCSIGFEEDRNTARTLRGVLDFIEKNIEVCDVRTTDRR